MNIFEKLSTIQNELKVPKKQFNKFGNYYFRSCEDILEAVKPICSKVNTTLIISDHILQIGNRFYVEATATLIDADEPGTVVSVTAYAREEESKKGYDTSQITGAASSYARKYALNGLFDIDDTKDSDSEQGNYDDQKTHDSQMFHANSDMMCEDCGGTIQDVTTDSGEYYSAKSIRSSSLKKYGRPMCYNCAAQEKRKIEAIKKVTYENADRYSKRPDIEY